MKHPIASGLAALVACLASGAALAQAYAPALPLGDMTDGPTGPKNEVMVLATPHLSQMRDTLRPEAIEPLVARLVAWKPNAVATEDTPGLVCHAMRQQMARYADNVASYCFDTAPAEAATGLTVPAADLEAEAMLADWPADPSPQMRRRLAALFLAAGEPASALVQWLRLPASERVADDFLVPDLAAMLERRATRVNETDLVAARVAAQAGLERVWSVDDQSTYMGELRDEEGYGKAISAAWDNDATRERIAEAEQLAAGVGEPGGLMALYRAYNDPSYATTAYRSDWGAALAEPSPEGFGRRYVAYWETRNVRMVANIREVLGRRPGTRMLAIVGASHKGYYEAYLDQMRDVQLVDVAPILAD